MDTRIDDLRARADLSDPTDRAMLGDAMEEAGRIEEARILRGECPHCGAAGPLPVSGVGFPDLPRGKRGVARKMWSALVQLDRRAADDLAKLSFCSGECYLGYLEKRYNAEVAKPKPPPPKPPRRPRSRLTPTPAPQIAAPQIATPAAPAGLLAPGTFDYGALPVADRKVVKERTAEIRSRLRRAHEDLVAAGRALLDVKARLRHGLFGTWLEAEFAMSQDTAERLMAVAERLPEIPHGAEFDARAVYLLASASTPESARQEALERAAEGEKITHTTAKAIVEKHEPAEKKEKREKRKGKGTPKPAPAPPPPALPAPAGKAAPEVVERTAYCHDPAPLVLPSSAERTVTVQEVDEDAAPSPAEQAVDAIEAQVRQGLSAEQRARLRVRLLALVALLDRQE